MRCRLLPLFLLLRFAPGAVVASDVITTRDDAVGRQLNKWKADGAVAGLAAIQYENRDGDHSPLPVGMYPELKRYEPTTDEKASKRNMGPANQVRPLPTFGNCSMAASATQGGSLPRMYLTAHPSGSLFISQQHLKNNLIIYPEHQDHDAGFNGVDGWGDLFPANHPALLISQGSSFSDMPFLKAWLSAAAALKPGVQRLLIEKNILVPTLNALFRQSNALVREPEDYFTGAAHPVVFDGGRIDEMKFITSAQMLSEMSVPPLAFLELVSESSSVNGVDFFDRPGLTERLSDSPLCLSRVFRSAAESREMKVSARRSRELQGKPLKFRWVLLQGDPVKVAIETSPKGDEATIRVRWHEGFASVANPALTTHRVDIGLFASSPVADSAPAIISFYMLPNEMRFFDEKGRLKEVCYQAPNPDVGIPHADDDLRWLHFMELVTGSAGGVAAEWVGRQVKDDERKVVAGWMTELRPKRATWLALRQDETRKEDAAKAEDELRQAISRVMHESQAGQDGGLRGLAGRVAAGFIGDLDLFLGRPSLWLKADATGALQTEVRRLVDWGVLIPQDQGYATAVPRAGRDEAASWYLRQLNLTVLSAAMMPQFLNRSAAPAFVDPHLTAIKPWRDVYRYDKEGRRAGWVRHHEGKSLLFTADGRLKPALGAGEGEALTMLYVEDDGRLVWRPAKK